MTDHAHVSREDRAEMFRTHVGLVTALIDDDSAAVSAQLRTIVEDQLVAAGGDVGLFAGRMGKQVEAGARVTRHVLISLAKRLDLSESEAHEIIAQAYSSADIEDTLPE